MSPLPAGSRVGVPAGRQRGFTLIELMITITLLGILTMLAAPAMSEWMRNSRVRSVADLLQNSLRTAQTEAQRLSRQTVMALTNTEDIRAETVGTIAAVAATGPTAGIARYSVTAVVPLLTDEVLRFVEAGKASGVANDVTITAVRTDTGGAVNAVCFNSVGRLVANATPGINTATCVAAPMRFDITIPGVAAGGVRPLRVELDLGGRVRMCDPARAQADSPDGCRPV